MNWRNIATVYLKEFKDTVRDRRALFSTILIPTLVIPLLAFGVGTVASRVTTRARSETPAIVVLGGADSPGIVARLHASTRFKVVATPADWKQQIADKKIRAAVELPAGFEGGLKTGAADTVTIYHYEGELKSSLGVGELEAFFRELRDQTVADRLREKALPASFVRPFDFKRENVAPPEKVGGNRLGGLVPYLIIIVCFTGAMYPAIDLTAGEKERGTLETLLCSPVARMDLVLGKFLVVLTGSLASMVFTLLSMVATALILGVTLLDAKKVATAAAQMRQAAGVLPAIDPLGLLGVMAMIFPVAVLFAAVAFTVALFAKTSKEAQSYLGPMIAVVFMPAVIGALPGIDLNARLALVPLLNLSLVCKEMLSGVWHWHYIVLIFGSSCVYAAAALTLAVRMFNREDVLFRA